MKRGKSIKAKEKEIKDKHTQREIKRRKKHTKLRTPKTERIEKEKRTR